MGTTSILIFYGCYFLLTALLFTILYQRAKHMFTREGWIILSATVLIGACSPIVVSYMGIGLSFAIFLFLTICLTWFTWRRTSEAVEVEKVSRAFFTGSGADAHQQKPTIQKDEQVDKKKENAESGLKEDEPEKAEKEMLLAFDEVAASQEKTSRLESLAPSAESADDTILKQSLDVIEFDFLQDDLKEETVPTLPAFDRQTQAEETAEEEGDQIIYFFDEEPSIPSEKKESSRGTERIDLLRMEEREWNFVKDNG